MATIDLDGILDSVHYTWNSLNKVVEKISKKWQELADSVALDPDADNSNYQFTVPKQYYATHYTSFTARSCTDTWNAYYNGYQEAGFCFELSLNDNVLNISNLTCLGKLVTAGGGQPEKWNYLNDTQKEQCLNDIKNYYEGQTIHIVNNYPDLPVIHSYGTYGTFIFKPTGKNNSDIYYKFNQYSGEVTSNKIQTQLVNAAPYLDDSDDLIHGFSGGILTQGIGNYYKGQPFEAVMDNLSNARNWVTTNGATNNYESSYLVFGGTMTVLYGDNYIIYVVPSGVKVNYNMLQEITKEVVTVINTDNPDKPPIDVPTYNDNKYGPQPPTPEVDEDIEVDMPVSAAAYGDGLTHYYICNAGATVLNDISAAMSSWDINNTGKDLYKNLISCRFTKIGSIPAENSTFSIYGEELLYNGSPISINKITGNPTIDLGEYEILPKFNDFRDYAPYTKIEMYIPYCGWVALPSHCMSSEEDPKIITGTLITDIIAATCKAIIKCNNTVVAEAAGFTAIDIPFVGENVGMKMAGIANSMITYGKAASGGVAGILSGAKGGSAGAGAAAAGGLVGIAGSYAQMAMAENANYTEICGKTGDGCQIGGLGSVYIKIQRPKTGGFESPDFVPAKYAHTTGFLCMKERTLGECSGFTVCANPDLSGLSLATDAEKAEIKRILETGIIINEAPESDRIGQNRTESQQNLIESFSKI